MFPLTFEMLHALYGVTAGLRSQKRTLWLALVIFAALSITVRLQQAPNLSIPAPRVTLAAPSSTTAATTTPPARTSPPVPVSAPSAVAAPQNCTQASYNPPAQINLLNQPTGLSQVIDPTAYYQVFGNTSAQIKAQLRQCAPAINSTGDTNFSAETGDSLVWRYESTPIGAGACTIGNIKVGLHLNMILPQWQPSGSEDSGLASSWQSLMSGLAVHEDGHVAIYQQYAQQLLTDLQSLPAADCASIEASVTAKSAADVAALNAANQAYDVRTNHGVNQGAVLR